MAPQIIQCPDGRIIRVANNVQSGYMCDTIKDEITGKIFRVASKKGIYDLYAVISNRYIYAVNSINDSSIIWTTLSYGSVWSGIRADGTYLYIVGYKADMKEYCTKIRISDKVIISETLLAPSPDAPNSIWDLNETAGVIVWEGVDGTFGSGCNNPIHTFDFNLNLLNRYCIAGPGASYWVVNGSMNSTHYFTDMPGTPGWTARGLPLDAYDLSKSPIISGEYGINVLLADETYFYIKATISGPPWIYGIKRVGCSDLIVVGNYSGIGTAVHCFIPDYDDPTKYLMVTDKGLVDIISMTLKVSITRQNWTHMCAMHRYCPTEI